MSGQLKNKTLTYQNAQIKHKALENQEIEIFELALTRKI